MNHEVDKYLRSSKKWKEETARLRAIILEVSALEEGFKWSKPCYTFEGHNIAIIQPFKNCLAIMFFKGALLRDPKGLLLDNGPNSQSARRFEFKDIESITKMKSTIKAYIKEAIAIEKSGLKVAFKKKVEALPTELLNVFREKPKFEKAFAALTPGRQRSYILYFISAKQTKTRQARIEKHVPRILSGKGLHD